MLISLPYGNSIKKVDISRGRIKNIIEPSFDDIKPGISEKEIVKQALKNPVGSGDLQELIVDKKKILIITSDHTRPVPSIITLPLLITEIRDGNQQAEIKILIATGNHRAPSDKEMINKFGKQLIQKEEFIIHDSEDYDKMVSLGRLPSGGELLVNSLVTESDLVIAEGFIEPHFFAGFSGGRKSILPGIASRETVLANHCSEFIAHEKARSGILSGNPIHRDMVYAAQKAGLRFILNVVLNRDKKIIEAFAGDPQKAHEQGCAYLDQLARVEGSPADVVITTNGGYPLDQNIYQTVKSMTAAEASCRQQGVIIAVSKCSDGHGGEHFYNTFAAADSIGEIRREILNRGRDETIDDQWESQILARILDNYTVIMVTSAPREIVENMHMHWAEDVEQALEMASEILKQDNLKINIIPDGVSVIVD